MLARAYIHRQNHDQIFAEMDLSENEFRTIKGGVMAHFLRLSPDRIPRSGRETLDSIRAGWRSMHPEPR